MIRIRRAAETTPRRSAASMSRPGSRPMPACCPTRCWPRMSDVRQSAWWSRALADPARGARHLRRRRRGDGRGRLRQLRAGARSARRAERHRDSGSARSTRSTSSPTSRTSGWAAACSTRMFRQLQADGFDTAVLWMLADNPTRFFYEGLGGESWAASAPTDGRRAGRRGRLRLARPRRARWCAAGWRRRRRGLSPLRRSIAATPLRRRARVRQLAHQLPRLRGGARVSRRRRSRSSTLQRRRQPLISAHERPPADRRFRFPGHPADRPARARGRGLLRDPSLPVGRRRPRSRNSTRAASSCPAARPR